jgi:hypothetical protein
MTHVDLFESLGWKRKSSTPSLQEVHKSVPVPKTMSFFRKLLAFSGPGYMVAVGYMDPGNWATDLAGGASFGYTLLFVLLSNLFAILCNTSPQNSNRIHGFRKPARHFPNGQISYLIMAEVMITAWI